MIILNVCERQATALVKGRITTDSVGLPVEVNLSPEYDGLAVWVCFRAGETAADVALMEGTEVTVPSQCLQVAGEALQVGVWAGDGDGNVRIPTVWASAGTIKQGTERSGIDPAEPAPDWAAQVQQAAANAVATANSVRADADAGVFDGEDGYSPTATVEQLADGATISITDKDGTTTATVHDGADGRDGRDGTDGVDGYSPTAAVTQTTTGATISITDKSGTTTASVSNGTDGTDGTDGSDGFSPTVDVQPITGGHEVTITDSDGAHSFEVLDGDPSAPGSITDELLAPDGVKAQVAQLWGNQLTGTISGTIDTASDAYAAPPMALSVDGVSTQVTTTGKNLLSDVADDWSLASLGGTSYMCTFVPVADGASYFYHREIGNTSVSAGWADGTDGTGFVAIASMSSHNAGYTFTNSDNHTYLVFYFASSATAEAAAKAMSGGEVQVEAGTLYSGYEVYTGMAASPRPDWPQPIVSIENPTLHGVVANWLDLSAMIDGYRTNQNGNLTTGENYKVSDFIPVPPNTDFYVYHALGTSYGYGVWLYDAAKTPIRVVNKSGQVTNGTFTTDANCRYVRISTYLSYTDCYLVLGTTATGYVPYDPASFAVQLYDGTLRSLPDGTKDELHLSYLRPSTRAGWAWYARSVTKRVLNANLATLSWYKRNLLNDGTGRVFSSSYVDASASTDFNACLCDHLTMKRSNVAWEDLTAGEGLFISNTLVVGWPDADATVSEFVSAIGGYEFLYATTNPVTTQLDPIELPELPAPNVTVFCDGGSAQPTYSMQYVQDTNLVIAELRTALADLATS